MSLAGYEPRVRWAEAAVPEPVRAPPRAALRLRPHLPGLPRALDRQAHLVSRGGAPPAAARGARTADGVAVRRGGGGSQLARGDRTKRRHLFEGCQKG